MKHLATIAASHPQATYAVFTHGFLNKWTYLTRTTSHAQSQTCKCLTSFRKCYSKPPPTSNRWQDSICDLDRKLFTLPAHLCGLNIINPTSTCSSEYKASVKVTAPLVHFICQQTKQYDLQVIDQQYRPKAEVRSEKKTAQGAAAANLY